MMPNFVKKYSKKFPELKFLALREEETHSHIYRTLYDFFYLQNKIIRDFTGILFSCARTIFVHKRHVKEITSVAILQITAEIGLAVELQGIMYDNN